MATITQTVEETITFMMKPPRKLPRPEAAQNPKSSVCPPNYEACEAKPLQPCPPDCKICKQEPKGMPLIFNAIGIVIAVLATYLIISTDSKLYLVFWICYSVLRRMMSRSKPRVKTE